MNNAITAITSITLSPQLLTLLCLLSSLLGLIMGLAYRWRLINRRIDRIIGTASSAHTTRHATIVAKRRGTSKEGGRFTYYMVGPVRERERDAVEDLVRWQAAAQAVQGNRIDPPSLGSAIRKEADPE